MQQRYILLAGINQNATHLTLSFHLFTQIFGFHSAHLLFLADNKIEFQFCLYVPRSIWCAMKCVQFVFFVARQYKTKMYYKYNSSEMWNIWKHTFRQPSLSLCVGKKQCMQFIYLLSWILFVSAVVTVKSDVNRANENWHELSYRWPNRPDLLQKKSFCASRD